MSKIYEHAREERQKELEFAEKERDMQRNPYLAYRTKTTTLPKRYEGRPSFMNTEGNWYDK